jgi:hypothetical protein
LRFRLLCGANPYERNSGLFLTSLPRARKVIELYPGYSRKQFLLISPVAAIRSSITKRTLRERSHMSYTIPQLLSMSSVALDELFQQSRTGEIPNGEARGTAIIAPGTAYSEEIAQFINHFAWQGKTFDAASGTLVNRILPFGLNAILAKVYKGQSWFDQKECIVLDYSSTSLIAHWIRDEIRLIGSEMYLGLVYWDNSKLIHFALQF